MSKGTPSFGKHNKISHIRCRRCGRHSYHIQKKECSACGYPLAKRKHDSWKWKPINRSGRKNIAHKHQKVKTARQGRHKSNKLIPVSLRDLVMQLMLSGYLKKYSVLRSEKYRSTLYISRTSSAGFLRGVPKGI